MKRFTTFIGLILCFMNTMAHEYTDKLIVTVNGISTEQQATISITEGEDGKYTLSLNNFCLESVDNDGNITRIGVGNIILPDQEGTTVDGVTSITYNDSIHITEGNDPEITFWLGPTISEVVPVPIDLNARFNDTQLYCLININLDILNQVIKVEFGSEPETSIKDVPTPLNGQIVSRLDKTAYDLQGRKATSLQKRSIYIIEGKKIVIQ